MSKTLYHPVSKETVTVHDRAAEVLKKSGWTEKDATEAKGAGGSQAGDKERTR